MSEPATPVIYGLAAEFSSPEAIVEAASKAREAGYTKMDAYTPFPVTDLDEALGMPPTRLGWAVLFMGTVGALLGFFIQWYANVIAWPLLNIGGRPLNDWPSFIVITFEVSVLFAAFTAGLLMFARNGLPQPYHSIFNHPNFAAVSRDKFLLCIEASDARFDPRETKSFLLALKPNRVDEVAL